MKKRCLLQKPVAPVPLWPLVPVVVPLVPLVTATVVASAAPLGAYGGSRASESAVDAALRWFKRHQSPNGMWDVDGYPVNCTLAGAKCEPGTDHTGADGDAAMTGYAVFGLSSVVVTITVRQVNIVRPLKVVSIG